jgi:hypothetical protein
MPTIKTFCFLAIAGTVLLISSPGIAGFIPEHGEASCEYIRRNINSRLPKGINLDRSVVKEVSINGRSSRECIVYGNPTALQHAWSDYRQAIPKQGLALSNGTYTLDGHTYPETLYYGWNESYIPFENGNAILVLSDSGSARN